MTIKRFAEQYRLKTRLDECGDPIIPGRRGQLYFDGPALCLMVTDGRRSERPRWEALGGKLWMGDPSMGVQDVKVTSIPLENAKAAIRMAGIKAKRILTPERLEALIRAGAGTQRQRVESSETT